MLLFRQCSNVSHYSSGSPPDCEHYRSRLLFIRLHEIYKEFYRQEITEWIKVDCVDGVCTCVSRQRLPKPDDLKADEITTSSGLDDRDGRSYVVSWKYSASQQDAVDVSYLVARVEKSEQVLGFGIAYRKVGEEYRRNVKPGPNHFQQTIHHIHSNFRVRVVAYDLHHCEGLSAEVYFNSE